MVFAVSSFSPSYTSASPNILEAHGVADKINMLPLNTTGNGRKYTATKQNSGKAKSLPKIVK